MIETIHQLIIQAPTEFMALCAFALVVSAGALSAFDAFGESREAKRLRRAIDRRARRS